jgi:NHLM bacteriocin system ABC transporter ATP-binding protein
VSDGETSAVRGTVRQAAEPPGAVAAGIEVRGNTPVALDEALAGWHVEAGKVDVFAVPGAGSAAGLRTFLATLAAGETAFAASLPPAAPCSLLLVAVRGARLRRLGGEELRQAAGDPGARAELVAAVDSWVGRLSSAIAPAAGPNVYLDLQPGHRLELPAEGGVVRARQGVVWARNLARQARFLGDPGLEVGAGPVPISEHTWMEGAPGTSFEAEATGDLLAREELWTALAGFHRLVLTRIAQRLEQAEARDGERAAERRALDDQAMTAACVQLAAVLEPGIAEQREVSRAADPLLAACQAVGTALGIAIRAGEGGARPGARPRQRIADVCAASGARSRRVVLRGDWWLRDNGPLVAFRKVSGSKDGLPVALLPTSPTSYELVDPVERRRGPVDAGVGENLNGVAYMLYPALPEGRIGKLDLLRLGLRGRRRDLLAVLAMGVAGGLLATLVPIITGQIFGSIIPAANRGFLVQMVLALGICAAAGGMFELTRSIAVLRIAGRLDGVAQASVWDRLLRLPASFFRRYSVGDLASRAMGVDSIRELFTGDVLTSILGAVFSLFSFLLLFYYSWRLALLAAGLVLVLLAATALMTVLQMRHRRSLAHLQGKLLSLLFGLINGLGKLRVAGAERRAFELWSAGFARQRQLTMKSQELANLQTAVSAAFSVFAGLAIFAMVGFSSEVNLSLGDFLAFNAAFAQFLAAALAMISVLSSVLSMVPLYERLVPIFEQDPEVSTARTDPGELAGDLEFSHVSFQYSPDSPLVLDDVSFRARPGEFIALIGPSGSGKSTCLRLTLGFERPASGSIYFDGQDLASLAIQAVRRQIGTVLQSGRPMVGDIFTNIVGNSSSLTLADAWAAARMAGMEEDIDAMPMGMHTVVSEGAETFSGGQKQRLLIARAIVQRPRIILFDEATSSLDNRTQEVVSRSLERMQATRVVIAHRLSTIVNADRIFVLQAGKVVESGTYHELVARGGLFAQLAARQIA